MNFMFTKFIAVYDLNMKFRKAQTSGDFSIITEDDLFVMKSSMSEVATIW